MMADQLGTFLDWLPWETMASSILIRLLVEQLAAWIEQLAAIQLPLAVSLRCILRRPSCSPQCGDW